MTEFAIFEQFNLNNRIRIINPFITSCIVLLKSGQRMCLQYTTQQCPALFVQRQKGAHYLFIRTERRVPLSCRSFWKRGCECMPWCPGWPLLLSAIVAALVHQLATNTRRSTQHKYVHVGPIIPLFICAQPAIRLRLVPLLIRHVLLHTWLHKRGSVKQERINSMYQKSQWTIFHPPRRNRRRWRTKGQPSSSSTSTTTVLFARILHRFCDSSEADARPCSYRWWSVSYNKHTMCAESEQGWGSCAAAAAVGEFNGLVWFRRTDVQETDGWLDRWDGRMEWRNI